MHKTILVDWDDFTIFKYTSHKNIEEMSTPRIWLLFCFQVIVYAVGANLAEDSSWIEETEDNKEGYLAEDFSK